MWMIGTHVVHDRVEIARFGDDLEVRLAASSSLRLWSTNS